LAEKVRLYLLIVTLVVGLPALLAYAWFLVTGDVTLRPLAQIRGDFSELSVTRHQGKIRVQISWGDGVAPAIDEKDVTNALRQALQLYDVDFQILVEPSSGDRITVAYFVDDAEFGPFPLRQSAKGLELAVAALRIR